MRRRSPVLAPQDILGELFAAALEAAVPEHLIARHLPPPPRGRTLVLGAGKAAASMARAVELAWPDVALEGLVVTRYGHSTPTDRIEVVEAAHPVPDAAGADAAARILELARGADAKTQVLCLISGGASALLSLPADGISVEEKQAINQALLRCGAPIDEMNVIRKRLSAVKGGRLAAAIAPARALSLLISDVPGDSPAVIGSGPTVADTDSADHALMLLERYALEVPAHVLEVMRRNATIAELPANQEVEIIATPQKSLQAAARRAAELGVESAILGDSIEGEAREVARVLAAIARQTVSHGQPLRAPCVLLSGGETTVTVKGNGRGGRNAEFVLALAIAMNGLPNAYAIACDTDGIDGSEDNAGARIDPTTLARALDKGLTPRALLDDNDAYALFAELGDLIVTGPTLTNVNDFRAIYIGPDAAKEAEA